MRRLLDGIYAGAMWAACVGMVAIGVMVLIQVLGRVLDRILVFFGASRIGIAVPSLSEFAGAIFVGVVCLALPATLRRAGHVRVTFLARVGGPVFNRLLTSLVLGIALGLAVFATWHSGLQALDSYQFNSLSYGRIPIPLWLPQTVMTTGFAIFALALLDELVVTLRGGEAAFRAAERARSEDGGDT